MRILVSACLIGIPCRYNGDAKSHESILALSERHMLIPICPEQLGGLSTPRLPSERLGDQVYMNDGTKITAAFEQGAEAAVTIALITKADLALMKNGSPSCGVTRIYDGSFQKKQISGRGIATEKLQSIGIQVFSEEDQLEFLK